LQHGFLRVDSFLPKSEMPNDKMSKFKLYIDIINTFVVLLGYQETYSGHQTPMGGRQEGKTNASFYVICWHFKIRQLGFRHFESQQLGFRHFDIQQLGFSTF
jgi:hypothetical protein